MADTDTEVHPPESFTALSAEDAEAIAYILVQKTDSCSAAELSTSVRSECVTRFALSPGDVDATYAFVRQKVLEDDRVMNKVENPPRNPLPSSLLFRGGRETGDVNIELLRAHFLKEGRLSKEDAIAIFNRVGAIMHQEPNLLQLSDPITIAGDIHGQYFDLMRLFHVGGDPNSTQYLFLGDYVDRGCFSSEVILLLFAYKIAYPQKMWMLRGNHECRHLTEYFNFKEECMYKYDLEVYDAAMNAFDNLPVSALVNKKFLCVHGGLSPDVRLLSDINEINRFQEVPREGAFCDLLWADPAADEESGDFEGKEAYKGWFFSNEARHCSYKFGKKACQFFLQKNGLTAVIRGHEVMQEGYKMHFKGRTDIPCVFTIFSAPNYCDAYKNKGSCLKIENNSLNIRQFIWTDHPYYLPNFMDVFTWSLPFVAEKVTSMLGAVLEQVTSYTDPNTGDAEGPTVRVQTKSSKEALRNKILAVSKVMQIYNTLRQEQVDLIRLKQLSPNRKLPNGVLAGGREAIQRELEKVESSSDSESFMSAKETDKECEAYPNVPKFQNRSSTMFTLVSQEEQNSLVDDLSEMEVVDTPSISVLQDFAEEEVANALRGLRGGIGLAEASKTLVDG